MTTCRILSVSITTRKKKEIIDTIFSFIKEKNPHHIITANSIMIKQSFAHPLLAQAFEKAHLVIADGMGIIWAARVLRQPIPVLFPGIDLMYHCFMYAQDQGLPVYLLGGKQQTIESAVQHLRQSFPRLAVAGYRNGYFNIDEEQYICKEIAAAKPAFVFIGIDSPRQEIWISRNMSLMSAPVIVGVGGSFDVLSGILKRAPLWMRHGGLEWLFRTCQQPWRLWRIRQLPLFLLLILLQKYNLLPSCKPNSKS